MKQDHSYKGWRGTPQIQSPATKASIYNHKWKLPTRDHRNIKQPHFVLGLMVFLTVVCFQLAKYIFVASLYVIFSLPLVS